MTENLSVQMLQRLRGRLVKVDTPVGPFRGTLRKADCSQHQGIGNLLLETWEGQLLIIRLWATVKLPSPSPKEPQPAASDTTYIRKHQHER